MTLSSTKQLLSNTLLLCTLIAKHCADWIKNTINTMSECRIMVWQYFANHCAWMYLVEESAGRDFGTAPSSVSEDLPFQMLLLRVRGKGLSSLCCYPPLQLTEAKMILQLLSHHSSTSEHKSTSISKKELNSLLGKH